MPEHKIIVNERFNDAGDPDGYRWRIGYETGVTDEAGYQAIEAAVRKAIGPPLPEAADNTDSVNLADPIRRVWLDLQPGDVIVRKVNDMAFDVRRAHGQGLISQDDTPEPVDLVATIAASINSGWIDQASWEGLSEQQLVASLVEEKDGFWSALAHINGTEVPTPEQRIEIVRRVAELAGVGWPS